MNLTSVEGDAIETRLRCLGATDIQKVQGSLYFVTFQTDGEEVSYTYNINAKSKYFLQRIKPYPLPEGIFSDESQIVEFIKRDLKKFFNARNSHNFPQFVEVTQSIGRINKEIETFFLNYNVDKQFLDDLSAQINEVQKIVTAAKGRSEHIII